jgi:hypothetical protein
MLREHGRPRRSGRKPGLECLEGRLLLARLDPKPPPRPLIGPVQAIHTSTGAAYILQVTGPGAVRARPAGRGTVAITLFGTTSQSQVTLTQALTRARYNAAPLQIKSIDVRTGALGSFQAPGVADLVGPMTPLGNSVSLLQFDDLGPAARIDVAGNLGELDVSNNVVLGPTGTFHVAGSLTGPGSVGGSLALQGATFAIDGATGSLNISGGANLAPGSLLRVPGALSIGGDLNALGAVVAAGQLSVQGNVAARGSDIELAGSGDVTVARDLTLDTSQLHVAGDMTHNITVGDLNLVGGQVLVDRDWSGQLSVNGQLTAQQGSKLVVGRDFSGGIADQGNLVLSGGSSLVVGRNLGALSVTGDLDTSMGGTIQVGGNLSALTVAGVIRGQGGSPSDPVDLGVGLDLDNLQVLGGQANQGSVQHESIDVGKNIVGIDIRHGVFNSFITAGVLIDGVGSRVAAASIGPDGPVAVFDSEIRAGVQVRDLTINGDVKSDRPTNPAGRPARIVAGLDRAGDLTAGGNIDSFQITGSLIDAVLAASVRPNGGDGQVHQSLPNPGAAGDNGFNTYDAPGGKVAAGRNPDNTVLFQPNVVAPPYDATLDPTIDDGVLPGAINLSFAPPTTTTGQPTILLPSRSTVLGGVISTAHGDEADFAGIFATNTRGVFVGTLPQ